MSKLIITLCIALSLCNISHADTHTKKIFLITFDGYRWQELFTGADPHLIHNKKYVKDIDHTKNLYWDENPILRRKKLTPFIWDTISDIGQIYGNRKINSEVNIKNPYWFSYPGYSEILTGFVDKKINSNKKLYNPNKTVLEVIHEQPEYKRKVAAFGSWDVFPYIINDKRSGIYINAGFQNATHKNLTPLEITLNKIQNQIPKIWNTVRYDAFTHHYAKEYVHKNNPKIVYIAYGETDDFAHDGNYQAYLNSAKQSDDFLKDWWDYTQQNIYYKNKTIFIITSDHGRGIDPSEEWMNHGDKVTGADQTWLIVYGAGIKAKGEISNSKPVYANQIASTITKLLDMEYHNSNTVGPPIKQIFK